ncbi:MULTISPECIES: DUF2784 domain-containing protein [Halomonadaceae]|uniref:DUF2784 domain-containing protein n=1 Tax=Vreelandella titanicae TaxID=664683 RepID=A0AAP9NK41_9GAMM|nr:MULTISPECIES: DUF2784 domain-containing protein [Halomonas]QKS23206.1 hypothetical protein FX987_00958 [Halomonas titanicae]CDG55594.1 conserved membrane hypothetical protein [Halomonas sp. A3H3]SDI42913.1 Protein of Unknown function [Halomonas titanicae]
MPPSLLLMLADTLLILHVLFVAFVVLGLVAIYAGYFFSWRWVRNRTFRIMHLCAIGYVVVQAWLGVVCPLTTWEMALRAEAGAVTYSGSFIQYWLHSLLYFTLPEWVFVVVYTLFGSLVLASWFVVKPRQHSP